MYEFHGWATIRKTAANTEENGPNESFEQIKTFINNLNWNSGLIDLRPINGAYHLTISGYTNRKGEEADDVFKLYNFVGNIAPGSYGLLQIWDDEDANGFENQFKVYALVRGILKVYEDHILSPCTPVIEDEYVD